MPANLPCRFSREQLAYVESLPDDLSLLTGALNTLDEESWSAWLPLTWGIADWSSHVRDHHGVEVAFRAELMLLQAHVASFVSGWDCCDVLKLFEPINGFWRV